MKAQSKFLTWLDLEATSLDFDTNTILEIAVHITDNSLRILDEGLSIVISQPDRALAEMDTWSRRHHTESGLLEEAKCSTVTLSQAEEKIISHIKSFIPDPENSPLCGSSVTFDRIMMMNHMPHALETLHYKSIDVSTVKELARRWFPSMTEYNKSEKHRALPDIRESIAELRYYKEGLFRV